MRKKLECRWWEGVVGAAAICGLLMMVPAAFAHDEESDGEWTMGGQDLHNWRNQKDTKISPHNVAKLKTKWTFTTDADVSATPSVANGVVYLPDFAGNFYAVNAKTGALIWKQKVSFWTGVTNNYSRNSPVVYRGTLILGDQAGTLSTWDGAQLTGAGARVMAVNAKTGTPIWATQIESFPGAIVTSSPVVHDGKVYVGVASFEEATAAIATYPCCV